MPEAVPDLVRCPDCGAGNAVDAQWCGQCHRRFSAGGATAGARAQRDDDHAPGLSRTTAIEAQAAPPTVETRDGEPIWICPACEAENPLEAPACSRCGSSFTSFFGGTRMEATPRASGGTATWLSAAFPGLGHWSFGEKAPAITRAVLYVWTLGISILLLFRPPAAGRGIVRGLGIVFALSAAGVWLLSLLETMRFAEGDRRPLIPPKALTWFSAALSGTLMLGLLVAAVAGR